MWWVTAAGVALLALPAAAKELADRDLDLPQAQDSDLEHYDDYNPFDDNGKTTNIFERLFFAIFVNFTRLILAMLHLLML